MPNGTLLKGLADTHIRTTSDLHITFFEDSITYTVIGKTNLMSDFEKIFLPKK